MSTVPTLPGVLIDNKLFNGPNQRVVINPSTEERLAVMMNASNEEAELAVRSALRAFPQWSAHENGRVRVKSLQKFADLVERERPKLVKAIQLAAGKPDFEADLEITQVVAVFRYFGEVADKVHGEVIPNDSSTLVFTDRVPHGVIAVISPWNFPLQLWAWRTAPALAVGCTIVWKPAEETSFTAHAVCSLIAESFPPGVINVCNGKGSTIGTFLSTHQQVAKVAFTGSTEIGKTVAVAAGQSNLKLSGLELGGKSPIFVLGKPDDQTLAQVAETCHHAVMWNAGQCCSAGSRTYVAADVWDEFLKESIQLCKTKQLGNPLAKSGVTMGPVISKAQQKSVCKFVEDARTAKGVRVAYEATKPEKGFFVGPTIVVAEHGSEVSREEIFGPVQVLIKLPRGISDDEILKLANDSIYGLAGAYFGEAGRCIKLARKTESGIIWVNSYNILGPHIPFGGVKQTGGSLELGLQATKNYTHPRVVVAKL